MNRMVKEAVQQGRSERRAEAYPLGYVEGLNDARTKLAGCFSILLTLLEMEQGQTCPQPCFRENGAMHPKRWKLFDWLFPADLESVGGTILTELCRTDDERSAFSMQTSADLLHAFGQARREVPTVIGHPVIDHVIGMRRFSTVRFFV